MWQDWINGFLGLALIVVAFLGLTGSTLTWTLFVLGALVAIAAFWAVGTRSFTSTTSESGRLA